MNINKKDRAVDLSEKCIEELKRQIINGRTREEALELVAPALNKFTKFTRNTRDRLNEIENKKSKSK